jgi:hypothetical protein
MNTSAFIGIMLIVIFAFIAGMIWAYRKNDYKVEKKEFVPEVLNSFDATLESVTVYSEQALEEIKKRKEEEEKKKREEEDEKDPLAKIELESRKKIIQEKNHIKKSAADEYFEKTRMVANEILKPKT